MNCVACVCTLRLPEGMFRFNDAGEVHHRSLVMNVAASIGGSVTSGLWLSG